MCAKAHGKNYTKFRPPLVRHLLRNRLLHLIAGSPMIFYLSCNSHLTVGAIYFKFPKNNGISLNDSWLIIF